MTQPPDGNAFFARDRGWHPPLFTPAYKSTTLRAPRHALLSLDTTLSETTGPVFGHGTIGPLDNDLTRNFSHGGEAIGQRIVVFGQVIDENGRPVPDALIEVWQANAGGRYRHARESYQAPLDPNFGGCGRTMSDVQGFYAFRTVRPGAYPYPNRANDWRPAHIHFSLFGHAFAQRLITQMYFDGDPMIADCAIVNTIADPAAVDRLVAKLDRRNALPMDALAYRFDIVLRGRRASVVEACR